MPRDLTGALRRKVSFRADSVEEYVVAVFGREKIRDGTAPVVVRMEDIKDSLLEEVEETWTLLRELKEKVDLIKGEQDKILGATNPDDTSKGFDILMEDIKKRSLEIRIKLQGIDEYINEDHHRGISSSEGSAKITEIRMRKTQSASMKKSFMNTMYEYQRVQTEYRERCKGRIRRQIEISGRVVSEQDVEEMIEKGNWNILGQNITMESQEVRRRLADVQARHHDILKLEKSLLELNELFMDMTTFVDSQGEMVDRIESHVASAQNSVDDSVRVLTKATKFQRSSRRKKIYIIVTAVSLLTVLALIIYSCL